MVSMATAVLPVWRSPMISSRWPRPTGISESIAFRPVCTGSCTDLRGMMPGAFTSTRRRSATFLIGPLPSIGSPSGLTTRPSRPLPTGTSTISPRRRTSSPSLMSRSSPKITMPTLSRSRFRAMPFTPAFGNSTISPAWTLSRPWTRAMPSPTDSTWPMSETSASSPKLAICDFRIAEISAARMSMGLRSLQGELQSVELGLQRGVVETRPDLDLDAAEDRRVDGGGDLGLLAQRLGERLLHARELGGGQLQRRGHLSGDHAAMLVVQALEGADDGGQGRRAAVLGQKAQELHGQRREAGLGGDRLQSLALLLGGEGGRGDQPGEVLALGEQRLQPLEVAQHGFERLGVGRQLEQRLRIALTDLGLSEFVSHE